jgi:hypothetical protein
MKKPPLTAEYVKSILNYNPATGRFVWKYRNDVGSRWNSRFAGEIAGSFDSNNYLQIGINSSLYRAHRLAWLIVTGKWPQFEIDHEDGDVFNNKWSNLREATHQENLRNQKMPSNNTSGVKGVSWHKRDQKWQVQIKIDGTSTHLGYFDSFDEAVAVRKLAELDHFGNFRRKAA